MESKKTIKEIISKAYKVGLNDGYAELYNSDYVGCDESKLKKIKGLKKVTNEILNEAN